MGMGYARSSKTRVQDNLVSYVSNTQWVKVARTLFCTGRLSEEEDVKSAESNTEAIRSDLDERGRGR